MFSSHNGSNVCFYGWKIYIHNTDRPCLWKDVFREFINAESLLVDSLCELDEIFLNIGTRELLVNKWENKITCVTNLKK